MIHMLLALAAAAQAAGPAPPQNAEAALGQCFAAVKANPENAVTIADNWRTRGGGIFARQCLGQAYAALERWAPAATAFEQAALEARGAKDLRETDFWVQSGNAWLAGGDGGKARTAFDAALLTTTLSPELRGEVHLDRARAMVLLSDLSGARADLDKGLALVPADPFAWLLSAALARRQQQLPRAQIDIDKALELAPNDADVLLEAGNIAGAAADLGRARAYYERAAAAAPGSQAGQAARAALGPESPTAP